jgi:hypothetical protein
MKTCANCGESEMTVSVFPNSKDGKYICIDCMRGRRGTLNLDGLTLNFNKGNGSKKCKDCGFSDLQVGLVPFYKQGVELGICFDCLRHHKGMFQHIFKRFT